MSKRTFTDEPIETPSAEKKKRKSRWASDDGQKIVIPGMPTQLPPNLDSKQEQIYLLQFQVEEITRKLRTGELGISPNPEDRSPSPEPVYNSEGKRMNTREYRTRRKLEDDRHKSVTKLNELNPEYKPPNDYKPPQIRITDKVFIPQDDYPDINFVGLLIGPRGNTLKSLEKETGAKVIIRGKGSVKEGKVGRKDGLPMPGEDEPLHAYITAQTAETVQKAVNRIREIIQQGIEVPEGENDLRKMQLRELALLNGTLRENDGLVKLRAIAEAQTIATNVIVCQSCGGAGHLAADCKLRRASSEASSVGTTGGPQTPNSTAGGGGGGIIGLMDVRTPAERAKMDSEYTALMAELGVGGGGLPLSHTSASVPPPPSNDGHAAGTHPPRPWQQHPPHHQHRYPGPNMNQYRHPYNQGALPPGMPPPPNGGNQNYYHSGGGPPPHFPVAPVPPPPPPGSNAGGGGNQWHGRPPPLMGSDWRQPPPPGMMQSSRSSVGGPSLFGPPPPPPGTDKSILGNGSAPPPMWGGGNGNWGGGGGSAPPWQDRSVRGAPPPPLMPPPPPAGSYNPPPPPPLN